MRLSPELCYQRCCERDRTYNGRFIVGVVTTGIYCIPTCSARKPKFENVRFYKTEQEAQAAGLRPCLRCRPDLFYRGIDPDLDLFNGIVKRLSTSAEAVSSEQLAHLAGVGQSTLNQLFRRHAHLHPQGFLRRRSIARARELLLHSQSRVIDIAHACGFDSEATFHRQFAAEASMTPGEYRGLRDANRFVLRLPASYRTNEVFAYHSRDPESVSEGIDGGTVWKLVQLSGTPVMLRIEVGRSAACCHVLSGRKLSLHDVEGAYVAAIRMLGLHLKPEAFEARHRATYPMSALVTARRGLRVPLTATPWEALAWSIIGQQINLSFATSLRRALIRLCGIAYSSGLRAHPTAEQVAGLEESDLTNRRFSRSKAAYLIGAARQIASGAVRLDALAGGSALEAQSALVALRGVGTWTARYTMLRGLGFADCVPEGDVVLASMVQKAYSLSERPAGRDLQDLMATYTPYRSLATCHFWAAAADRS